MVRSTVTTEHPIYALLAQFRIMSAVDAPLDAWENFQRELEREHAALRDGEREAVDGQYLDELELVHASVAERVARLRGRT